MTNRNGFYYENNRGKSIEWITPKWIIEAFNFLTEKSYFFDLDPCASNPQPWSCARNSYTIEQDGLSKPWVGCIWLNPPYGRQTTRWIQKMIKHDNGIAFTFARLDTELWQRYIFPTADGFLFLKGRISFSLPNGKTPKTKAGAPSVLIAWGNKNRDALIELCENDLIEGTFKQNF